MHLYNVNGELVSKYKILYFGANLQSNTDMHLPN